MSSAQPKKISRKNPNKRSYKKHIHSVTEIGDDPIYEYAGDIKIFTGNTKKLVMKYNKEIQNFKNTTETHLFSELTHSTLTADGYITNISFREDEKIHVLPAPTSKNIVRIGCNFGELYNKNYKITAKLKKSNKGRKPKKPKNKTRKMQGNGKYFNTQLTFNIVKNYNRKLFEDVKPPIQIELKQTYDLKLFRNGMFQVSGVESPTISCMKTVIDELCTYLNNNFVNNTTIPALDNKITDVTLEQDEKIPLQDEKILIRPNRLRSVMRNYKASLFDKNSVIHLVELENIINNEKINKAWHDNAQETLSSIVRPEIYEHMKHYFGNYNSMNIAEVRYNNDKIMLIIKLYRPIPDDIEKKHTVNIFVKGKINFDGANSELEAEHIYYWLAYIFSKYKNRIIYNVQSIENGEYCDDHTDAESIYDDDVRFEPNTNEFIII